MSNIKYVMESYINHVKNNVNKKPHMRFVNNGTPVKKLSSLYLIGDTSNKTECFIDAHGGNYSSDYVLDSKSFKVPTGVTVNFYQPAGYAFGAFKSELRSGPPKQHGGTNDQIYNAGDDCPNYILTKFQGRHSGNTPQEIQNQELDYSGFQAIASDADIILVTVRNRWFHSGITLQSTIKEVQKKYRSITVFNCMFCRVDDTTAGLAQVTWNASSNTGGNWY